MRRRNAVTIALFFAVACANTGDKFKDAAIDHNTARIAYNTALKGATIAVRENRIDKVDARIYLDPIVDETKAALDQMNDDLNAGRLPSVDVVERVASAARKILMKAAELEAKQKRRVEAGGP
jgi:hypothetical protein